MTVAIATTKFGEAENVEVNDLEAALLDDVDHLGHHRVVVINRHYDCAGVYPAGSDASSRKAQT